MPNLNALGEWCAGMGGVQVSWGTASGSGTVIWTPAGGADWVTQDVVVAQHCPGPPAGEACVIKTYNVRTSVETVVATRGANVVYGGGGVWAAFLAGYGVYSSTGLYLPAAGLEHVGPDGAVAIKRNYAGYGPYYARETSGLTWLLTNGSAAYTRLLGSYRAVWTEGGNPRTAGACPAPNPMTRPYFWLTMLPPSSPSDPDGWWCLYQDSTDRLLLHPVTSTSGYVLAPPGSSTYGPDLIRLSPTSLKVVWASNAGETPSSVVVVTVNTAASRTVLGSAPPPEWIEPIDPPDPPTPVSPPGGTRVSRIAPQPPPTPRPHPHVDGIKDWRAQQSVRLLWDQTAELNAQLTAAQATITELGTSHAVAQEELASVRRAAGEALAIAQQTAAERKAGAGGGGTDDAGAGAAGCSAAGSTGHVPAVTSPLDLTVGRAGKVVCGCSGEFPALLVPTATRAAQEANRSQLLDRIVWHLGQAGFAASRYRTTGGLYYHLLFDAIGFDGSPILRQYAYRVLNYMPEPTAPWDPALVVATQMQCVGQTLGSTTTPEPGIAD